MPIVLDDSILIPPSLRRGHAPRVYNVVQPGTTTTTIIESGSSHMPHRPLTPPRSPVFIHQETTSYIPAQEALEGYRGEVEYVVPGSRRRVYLGSGLGRSSRYRSNSIGADYEGGYEVARSRHYHDDEGYYHEDGSRHGFSVAGSEHGQRHQGPDVPAYIQEGYISPNESERQHHGVRRFAQTGLAAGALGTAKEVYDHRGRRRVADGYYSDSSDGGHDNHTGRKVAAAALGATAAGIAAHQIYRRRQKSRARSSDSYTSSSSDNENHTGRKVAGVALGATAAGIAAHKIRQHRRKSRAGSIGSRGSSSDRGNPHRKAKMAATTIGTGLTAQHIHHRREERSRSSSRTRVTEKEKEPWGRHLTAAALGATAAGLAHHEYKKHYHPERPRPVLRRSYSEGGFREDRRNSALSGHRSPSPHKHSKIKKAAATAVAAAVAKKAIDHYRDGRSKSRSSSRSPGRRHGHSRRSHSRSRSRSRSRARVGPELAATMLGAAVAGERVHRKHKEKKREREMHGGGVAVPNGDSHYPQVQHGSSTQYAPSTQYARPGGAPNSGGYAETIHSDSTMQRDNTPPPPLQNRSRRGSLGARLVGGLMDHISGAPDKRSALGDGLSPEAIAYKLGQTIGNVTHAGGKKY